MQINLYVFNDEEKGNVKEREEFAAIAESKSHAKSAEEEAVSVKKR